MADTETKKLDIQLDVNLRAVYLTARESIPLLKEAGAEHGKALMVNTASIAGKYGQGWLAAYSATKFGVVGPEPGAPPGAVRATACRSRRSAPASWTPP